MDIVGSINRELTLGKNVFITGPAGTGKTFVAKKVAESFEGTVAITALTVIAALNIGGTTVHSFSGIGIATNRAAISQIVDSFRWRFIR